MALAAENMKRGKMRSVCVRYFDEDPRKFLPKRCLI
jgi:hypothetical protein